MKLGGRHGAGGSKKNSNEDNGVDMIKTHCLHVFYSQRINDTYLMVKMRCNIVVSQC